jgi:hypothetical protein
MPEEKDLLNLIERLADQEHARWSRWQQHLHDQCEAQKDGSLVIPRRLVDRWNLQICTPYSRLPEHSKESDRKEARLTMQLIREVWPESADPEQERE